MTTQACNNRLKPLTNAYNHGRSLGHALPRSSMIKAAHSRTPNALISLHGACSIKAYVMLERTRLAKQVFSHAHNPSASQATFLTTAHKLCFQRLHVLHIHTITVAPGCLTPLNSAQGFQVNIYTFLVWFGYMHPLLQLSCPRRQ
eukprot:1144391-Pelagomonas_calceolata.AAC.1